jgi:cytochrome c553
MSGRARGLMWLAGAATALAAVLSVAHSAWAQQGQQPQPPQSSQQPEPQQPPAVAAPAVLKGDPARGKAISYTCLGCHGIDGYRNAYPDYEVPKLEGQHPEYIVDALHAYRSGDRAHLTMHDQASTLSDQDIVDIAAFFAGKPLTPTGRKESGEAPQAVSLCVTCHGVDGVGVTPNYPTLAGQHPDYLARAIEEYKRGGRKNPVMKALAANIKDEDIAAIAHYFGSQTPPLRTEERPYTVLTAH